MTGKKKSASQRSFLHLTCNVMMNQSALRHCGGGTTEAICIIGDCFAAPVMTGKGVLHHRKGNRSAPCAGAAFNSAHAVAEQRFYIHLQSRYRCFCNRSYRKSYPGGAIIRALFPL